MLQKLQQWLSGGKAGAGRPRIDAAAWPSVVYAIGDVHGCLDKLEALESLIIEDSAEFDGEKWIVMLGDYVDRGPDSAKVITKLIGPAPTGFKRICLTGNHEAMMLDYFDNPVPNSPWLDYGGKQALLSYGMVPAQVITSPGRERKALLQHHIPAEHIDWLRNLPVLLSLPGTVFVHAGLRPGIPLENQAEHDLIWIREPFLSAPGRPGQRIVHGHTPAPEPVVTPHRICIDTGVFATGILTSVRLTATGDVKLLNSAMAADADY